MLSSLLVPLILVILLHTLSNFERTLSDFERHARTYPVHIPITKTFSPIIIIIITIVMAAITIVIDLESPQQTGRLATSRDSSDFSDFN